MTRSGLLPAAAACAALLAILALIGPALAGPPMERTDPQHLAPLPPGGYDLPLAPPLVHFPMPPQWVMVRPKEDWRKAGTFDKKLSDACAARKFVEKQGLRFRASFKGEVLGVAFGHGLNLYDPGKLADPKMTYLFRNGDSTYCAVLKMRNEDRAVSGAPAGTPTTAPKRP